jgi:hypothetical protein
MPIDEGKRFIVCANEMLTAFLELESAIRNLGVRVPLAGAAAAVVFLEVFRMLSSQLDEQSRKWAQLKKEDLPKVSELIKQANLPALIIAEKK